MTATQPIFQLHDCCIAVQLDAVLGQAHAVGANLGEQRSLFENTGSKLMNLSSRFPIVNNIMNQIRRKKSKVCPPLQPCVHMPAMHACLRSGLSASGHKLSAHCWLQACCSGPASQYGAGLILRWLANAIC